MNMALGSQRSKRENSKQEGNSGKSHTFLATKKGELQIR